MEAPLTGSVLRITEREGIPAQMTADDSCRRILSAKNLPN
jgi:hypothetical protein